MSTTKNSKGCNRSTPCGSLLFLCLAFFLASCGSAKSTSPNYVDALSSKKIIKNHYANALDFKTIYAKVKARYKDKKRSQSVSVNLRMEKDKTIWLSASFIIPVAKVLITQDRVKFYEKVKRTYFDGDFSFLSEKLGTDLDFQKVQDLLLGQALFDLREEKYEGNIKDKDYVLIPEREMELFNRIFKLSPENFKMTEQRLTQPKENRSVRVTYPAYQTIQGKTLPKEIRIESLDGERFTTIEIDYRSVDFDKDLSFPFAIPNGYEAVMIK